MLRLLPTVFLSVVACSLPPAAAISAEPVAPKMLFQGGAIADPGAPGGARTSFAIMRLPDGGFAFYNRYAPAAGPLTLPDADGNQHTLLPYLPAQVLNSVAMMESETLANSQVILTSDNQVKSVYVKSEALDKALAAKVGLPRYLNVWIRQANLVEAFEPQMIWRGYNGSQMEYQQLANGRILVPYGSFQPHARAVPPNGRHKTIVQYSDDGGKTWSESKSKLISPCYAGFNGSNEGACEPAIEPLRDGRVWMLMRTQAGFLYESHSSDDGTTWKNAVASRFHTSTGPPNILRHSNGWLVVAWNNCEMPPRQEGVGVYGGRDALHIAVSEDEGSLNDRMFDPTNDLGEEFAVFRAELESDGTIGNARLMPDTWSDITFSWDLSAQTCRLQVDGRNAGDLKLTNVTLNGLSYIRFRSSSRNLDKAGFLVDSVSVSVSDPIAPACSPQDQIAQEKRYIDKMVPLWMPKKQVSLDD
jgi:hypothetical protein